MVSVEDEILIDLGEAKEQGAATAPQTASAFNRRFAIDLTRPLPERDTPFAKAYRVTAAGIAKPLYALLLEKHFAPRPGVIEIFKQLTLPGLQKVIDTGRYTLQATRTERDAVILEDITLPTLAEALRQTGALSEALVAGRLIAELASVLGTLSSHGIVHGVLNSSTVYYDPVTHHLVVGECFSSYCGYLQPPAYETLARALCSPEGKGDRETSCDSHAIGMLAASMLLGRDPFAEGEPGQILEARLAQGTYEYVRKVLGAKERELSKRMQTFFQAVFADSDKERWTIQGIQAWAARKTNSSTQPAHKLPDRTTPFIFQGKEYLRRQHLAQALFLHWEEARRTLALPEELARWLRSAQKNSEIADRIASQAPQEGVLLTDQRLARIIMLLDPEGPIRTRNLAVMPFGIGAVLAQANSEGNRDILRACLSCFAEDLIDYWMQLQSGSVTMEWSPSAMLRTLRAKALGFGYERCLYELNAALPCQSKLVGAALVATLKELLECLEGLAASKAAQDQDPIDRHIAAFISQRLRLTSEIRIRALHSYPHVAGNQQAVMLALLTVAQTEAGVKSLKGLAEWIRRRLNTLLEALHSDVIRKELGRQLDAAAKTGDLRRIYKVIAEGPYIKRDAFGFQEARRQYQALHTKITLLRQGRSVERMAFQKGLRIAAGSGYLVLVGTILLLLFRAV